MLFFLFMVGLLFLLGRILEGWGRRTGQPLMGWIARVIYVIAVIVGLMVVFVMYMFWTHPDSLFF